MDDVQGNRCLQGFPGDMDWESSGPRCIEMEEFPGATNVDPIFYLHTVLVQFRAGGVGGGSEPGK